MNDPEIIKAATDNSEVRIHEEKAYQGWLGKIFGSPTHAQTNIVGLLIVILLALIGLCVYKDLQGRPTIVGDFPQGLSHAFSQTG